MKKLVWLAGALLLFSFVFPNGITLPSLPVPAPAPAPVPVQVTDAKIAELLVNADAADKAHIRGVYTGLISVVSRDAGKLMKTTEQWEALHSRALQLAVADTPVKGKYPGLDVAIESVFESKLGKDKEVVMADEKTRALIIDACEVVRASTK
jgi:hypothetical protein